jgi:hypothetical protein
MLRTCVEGSDLREKGVFIVRTPGPEPIQINVTSFLVGVCNFVIQSGMSFEFEDSSPLCGGDDSIENSLRYLLLLLGSKAVGRILVTAPFLKIQIRN